MKVFVAGANGAIGKQLIPQLVAAGHEVVAMSRTSRGAEQARAQGAKPVVADALDRDAVVRAVREAAPKVVIHELTALTGLKDFKNFDREFAMTNRLRTEATDYLLEGARAAGARRIVAQSYGSWTYEPGGDAIKTEDDPLDPNPPANQRQSMAAIRYMEQAVVTADGIEGIALRYGSFYGPGTNMALRGDMAEMVRKRMAPIIGDGAGVWSFLHVEDAAAATVAAMQRGAPGIYNVADDDPAPVSVWLPEYARIIGANPPLRVPVWLGRLVAGEVGVSLMTRIRGISNAKAKRELGWSPIYASWREGFKAALG
ncbi:MAG TPA: NAD-dependent epimerase/dehydratase family protein [Ktedonobacterales bacterium]